MRRLTLAKTVGGLYLEPKSHQSHEQLYKTHHLVSSQRACRAGAICHARANQAPRAAHAHVI
jgi:hypothetical protein